MPTTLARCCAPVPPEPVAGYVTLGRGVTVHARSCRSFARMGKANPERVLRAQWNLGEESALPVRIRVVALDRRGLLRDVTDVCAQQKLSIDGVNSETDPRDHIATIEMRTAVRNQAQLKDVMKKLRGVRSVVRVERSG
jgi:GTP pyrophosphokinase